MVWQGATQRTLWSPLAVLFLAMMAVPWLPGAPADAPIVHGDDPEAAYTAAADAGLFGRFSEHNGTYNGQLVRFSTDPDTNEIRDLQHQGEVLIERLGPIATRAAAETTGPVARFTNDTHHATIHDNRYGWISYGALAKETRLRFPPGSTIEVAPEGITVMIGGRTLHLHYDNGGHSNVSIDDRTIRISPRSDSLNFTITLDANIHGTNVRPGSWWLLAQAEGTLVADVLRPTDRSHVLTPRDGWLELKMAPLSQEEDLDAAHRIESIGVFPLPPRLIILDSDRRPFTQMNASHIFESGPTLDAVNVSATEEVTRVLLRQAFGSEGPVEIRYDAEAPQILDIHIHNLTHHWQPLTAPLEMGIEVDEPVTGRLDLHDGQDTQTLTRTRPTTNLRFPLDGLDPEAHHTWRLTVTDLAGNQNQTEGTLTTPPDPTGLIPLVQIHGPEDGVRLYAGDPVLLRATVTDGAGGPLPADQVAVILDGQTITRGITWDRHLLVVELGVLEDGPHEARIVASGFAPDHVGEDTVRFSVGPAEPIPAVGLLPFLAVLLALVQVGSCKGRRRSRADLHGIDDALQSGDGRQ